MADPVEHIRILEVNETNLIQVVTDNEKEASFYSKTNLEVSALSGKLVLKNEGIEIINAFPYEVLEPKEESVVDLVEIIEGYINNIIEAENETVTTLKEILNAQNETTELLEQIKRQSDLLEEILVELKINNLYLSDITDEKFEITDIEE